VHTLVRVILIIPRLVTSSWYTQRRNWEPVDIAASLFDIAKTFIEAVALVVIPANVHSTLQEAETVLWRNEALWFPFDAQLNSLARTFLCRIKQSDLGISLGGFMIITKSLLLTLVSLTITFLTVFHEVRKTPFQAATNTTILD
ncbi:GUR-4 protein, partial [Aphelenchoides avenae]